MYISPTTENQTTSSIGNKETNNEVENNTFGNMLTNNKEEKDSKEEEVVEVKRTLDELVADIISLMKTGLTVDERERLQELLIELKDEIKEGNYSKEEIESMISNVEREIAALQKRISGQVIIDKKSDELNQNESESSLDGESLSFIERIESALETLSELNSGETKKKTMQGSVNESELLEMIKEFQK